MRFHGKLALLELLSEHDDVQLFCLVTIETHPLVSILKGSPSPSISIPVVPPSVGNGLQEIMRTSVPLAREEKNQRGVGCSLLGDGFSICLVVPAVV